MFITTRESNSLNKENADGICRYASIAYLEKGAAKRLSYCFYRYKNMGSPDWLCRRGSGLSFLSI